MTAQPAALYGSPVGGHDEHVPTSLRVMLTQGALLSGLLAGAGGTHRPPNTWILRRLVNSGHSADVAGRMGTPCRRGRPPAQGP